MIDLSIIIVNYNVKEFLLNLLDSIRRASKGISTEIIIVDNASDDGSVEIIPEKFPEVNFIASKKNLGFGSANNIAMEKAAGKYLLLINPDTIVKEDTFTTMLDFFKNNPKAGMAGCKVLNSDGTLQLACRRGFPGPWTSFTKVIGLSTLFPESRLLARYNLTFLDENATYEVDAISGAFMMMRREVYEKIGGFDQQFFMYGEDLDLCFRSQQAGYKVFYVHSTEIIHYKGESTKRSSIDETSVFYNAMHLFVKKHFSSSFIVEAILQFAIIVRKLIAFINIYRLVVISIILDSIFLSASIFISEKLYSSPHWIGFPDSVQPWIFIIPPLIQVLISSLNGSYRRNSLSVMKTVISLFYGILFFSALTFFLKQFAFSRAILLITYAILFVVYPLWRILVKVKFKIGIVNEATKQRTLIVGSGEKAIELASRLKTSVTNFYQIIGLIVLSRKNYGESISNIKILGTLENIRKVISENSISRVIFASDEVSFNQIFSVVSVCQGENVEFMVAGSDLDYLVGKSSVTILENIPFLTIEYNISSFIHKFTKAVFDKTVSMLILLFIYPFLYFFSRITGKRSETINFVLDAFKVFRGVKSFVGPKESSYYGGLFVGKTGLTGLWYTENIDSQDEEEVKKLDLFYAKNQNIWLDIEILGKAFGKMIFNVE